MYIILTLIHNLIPQCKGEGKERLVPEKLIFKQIAHPEITPPFYIILQIIKKKKKSTNSNGQYRNPYHNEIIKLKDI